MSLERGAQIDIGDDLSVDDDEGLAFEELARVVECSAGSEDHRFFDVMKLHAEADCHRPALVAPTPADDAG